MQRLICLSLFVLFTAFTFRSSVVSEFGKIASTSSEETYPFPDEDSGPDADSDSEDLEDVNLQITQPLSLTHLAEGSQKQIQHQQHIFNSLSIEVITPPPQD